MNIDVVETEGISETVSPSKKGINVNFVENTGKTAYW